MIRFDEATKTYGKHGKLALDHLNMTVPEGVVFGFLGPNGAGKTTAIRLMTGILEPTEGTVWVNGKDIRKDPLAIKREIGFVPDAQDSFDRLSGQEFLNLMADLYGVSKTDRELRSREYLEKFGMTDAATQRIQSYSRGMKQKMAVIGALIHRPSIWILDEPMVGLDPKASHLLKQEMRERADEGATVFFSTHVLEVAEKLCDRVGIIDHGHLLTEGSPEELRRTDGDQSLEDFFLQLTEGEEEKA